MFERHQHAMIQQIINEQAGFDRRKTRHLHPTMQNIHADRINARHENRHKQALRRPLNLKHPSGCGISTALNTHVWSANNMCAGAQYHQVLVTMSRRGGFEYFTSGEWGRVGFLWLGKVKAGRVDAGKRRRVG